VLASGGTDAVCLTHRMQRVAMAHVWTEWTVGHSD